MLSSGDVYCWGTDTYHQVGAFDFLDSSTNLYVSAPVKTRYITDAKKVSLGEYHACALTKNATIMCWGMDKGSGEVGQPLTTPGTEQYFNTPAPISVPVLTQGGDAIDISTGEQDTCVVKENGSVWCWGSPNGAEHRLDGTSQSLDSPTGVQVPFMINATGITSALQTTCSWTTSKLMWCWGDGADGLLARPPPTDGYNQVPLTGIVGAAGGTFHICAWTDKGVGFCWGLQTFGKLGNGVTDPINAQYNPSPIPATVGFIVKFGLGDGHTCALNTLGQVWCWGYNFAGQLGQGHLVDTNVPVIPILTYDKVKDVSAAFDATCILTSNDDVACFGNSENGGVGFGESIVADIDSFRTAPTIIDKARFDCNAGSNKFTKRTTGTGKKKLKVVGMMLGGAAVGAAVIGLAIRRRKRAYTAVSQPTVTV